MNIHLPELRDELAKFEGKSPYDTPSNICRNDPYYAKSLEEKYNKPIEELIKLARGDKS